MLSVSALLSASCRLTLPLILILTAVSGVHSVAAQEIDPRDYIGEDISKYPSHLRAKIERAFLRETGERFTGSQYDPRSPNYAFDVRKRKSSVADIDIFEGGSTPWERAGQLALSREPKALGGSSTIPSYIQNEIDDYETERRANEVNLKLKEAEHDYYINKKNNLENDYNASKEPLTSALDQGFLDWRGDISKQNRSEFSFIEYYQHDWKLISENTKGDWNFGVVLIIKTKGINQNGMIDKFISKEGLISQKTLSPIQGVNYHIIDNNGFKIATTGAPSLKIPYGKLETIRMNGVISSGDIDRLQNAEIKVEIIRAGL